MEDVLEVYHRQFGDNEVLVCLDETSKQLVKETRQPLPPQPRAAMAYDYEYQRNGVSNLFMLFAPLEGWTLRILSGISEGICNTMVQSGGEFLYIGVGGR